MGGLTILFDYCKCISYYYKMIIRSSHINYDLKLIVKFIVMTE